MEKLPCVYILAKASHSTLYTGVTSDLPARVWKHREAMVRGFTQRYGIKRLVWFEQHETSFRNSVRELHALSMRKAALKKSQGFWAETRELNQLVKAKMTEGHGRAAMRRAIEEQIERRTDVQIAPPLVRRARRKRMFALGFLLGFGWQAGQRK